MRRFVFFQLFLLTVMISAEAQDGREAVIKGRVTDASGDPLPGAGVSIADTYLGTHTDQSGKYSFTGLKKGSYSVTFSFIGYESVTAGVNTEDSGDLNISLQPKSYMTGEVTINAVRAGENTPLAYSTVTTDQLRKANAAFDMPYLLSLTPSFVETSEAGNGIGYTGMRIRGTDGNRINVTLDGIPLNDAESQQVFWVDLPDIASSLENIQIQRGAGTSSNGAGAFGATISLQTAGAGVRPYAEISSAAGSFGTFKNSVSAGTGLLNERFAVDMRYSDIKSDGYIKRTGSDHRSGHVSGLYRDEKTLLKANIIIGEEHTGIGWWGVPADSLVSDRRYNPAGEYTDDAGNRKYYDNESDNYRQDHYHLIFNRKLSDKTVFNTALHYTRGKGYYEEYREDQDFTGYGLSPVLTGNSLAETTDMIRQKWMANDFYGIVYSLKRRSGRLETVIGGGINSYEGDHFGEIIWMQTPGRTEKGYEWYINDSRKGEASIYGKANFAVSANTSLFGDLQLRHVAYRMRGLDDDLKDIGQTHRYTFFNPKTGIFHSISQNQDAWLSFSVANREPTRSDFKEAAGDPDAEPKPETLYDTELGYNLRTAVSSFSVNFYGMIYKDQLVPTGELSDVGYSIMTNVDKSYRIGAELSSDLRLSEAFRWNTGITLSRNRILDYIEFYTDYNTSDWSSQYKSKSLGDVDIAYSPSLIASSQLSYRIAKPLSIILVSKYVGKQYFDNTMNESRSIDPYFVNSLRLDFTPGIKRTSRFELQLAINNIFNTQYENNAYGGNWYEDGTEKTWSYFFPQAGRSFMGRISVKF